MNNTVYGINNDIFAAKDLIFGWCVSGVKLGLEEFVPISQLDIARIKVLRELYVGPLYPDDLRDALDECIKKLEELPPPPAEIVVNLAPEESMASKLKPVFRQFTMAEPSMFVLQQIEPQGESGRFTARFGMTWKKIPGHPNHRYIRDSENKVHVTLFMEGDEAKSIAFYYDMPFDEFRQRFIADDFDGGNRDVYEIDGDVRYAGGKVMERLKIEGRWE